MHKPLESLARVRHEFGEHGGVNRSIEASTTFTVLEAGIMPEIFQGLKTPEAGGCYLYGRHFNPTVYALGKELAALEGTEAAYGTASGMSAITSTLMQLCKPGDHIVASSVLYGGTYALLQNYLPERCNVDCTMVDVADLGALKAAFKPSTKLLYVETMSNPTLVIADLPKLAEIAHRHGALLVVDNTFCPLIVNPVQHGADIVLHSLTKFISGASDIIAGAVCGSQQLIAQLMDVNHGGFMLLGPTMDPKVAFELSLRLPHLGLRMREHSARTLLFATRLQARGLDVIYPGLPNHPQHDLLARMGNVEDFGFGGVFCVDMGSTARAFEFMNALQNQQNFGYIAVSLGYFDTLLSCSAVSTSSEMPEEQQRGVGLSPGLVRISIGYTGGVEQRWTQFDEALQGIDL